MKHILLQQMEGNVLCSSAVQIMVGSFEESYWNKLRYGGDSGGWINEKGLGCWEIFLLGKENVKIKVASLSELDWVQNGLCSTDLYSLTC